MSHTPDLLPIRDGIYTTAWVAACSCGWTGLERPARGAATVDLLGHLRDPATTTPKD